MTRPCPICGNPADSATSPDFPFCSERCQLLDLGNWSAERYVISEPAFDETMFENLERQLNEPAAQQDSDSDGPE